MVLSLSRTVHQHLISTEAEGLITFSNHWLAHYDYRYGTYMPASVHDLFMPNMTIVHMSTV